MLARRLFLVALLAAAAAAAPALGEPNTSRQQQRLTSAETYVPMPTLSAGVVAQGGRATGTIVIDVGLDVPDLGLRTRAQAMQPLLVDALRTALSTFATVYYRDRTAPDLDTLSRLM